MNEEDLRAELSRLEEKNLLRSLIKNHNLVDFTSNDYLGLTRLIPFSNLFEGNQLTGAGGSRLLSGNFPAHEETENALAEAFASESALLFPTGYMANVGVLSAIARKGDTILYDENCHASIKDGARLSLANKFSFKHNDLSHLNHRILKATGRVYVVVEALYSMDGDFGDLRDIAEVCEGHNAFLIVDEAHSTGIYGVNGSGLSSELEITNKIFLRIHTFGKAMGLSGAAVLGSKLLTDYLINTSRPFIYTTAMPVILSRLLKIQLDYLIKHQELRENLESNISLFNRLSAKETVSDSRSPIKSVLIPGNQEARNAAKVFQQEGFDVRAILAPTVKAGSERLRIIIHAYNTSEEIENLTKILNQL